VTRIQTPLTWRPPPSPGPRKKGGSGCISLGRPTKATQRRGVIYQSSRILSVCDCAPKSLNASGCCSGHWAVTLVEQRASRSEVIMAFNNGWGWKDRKYVLTGNNGSGTLELQLTAKQTYDGFMVCDAPMCCGNGRVGLHDNVVMEMDGEDVMDNIEKEGNKGCMWVAHPMTPGVHTLGFKCVLRPVPGWIDTTLIASRESGPGWPHTGGGNDLAIKPPDAIRSCSSGLVLS
jgi:hypothetical protein